MSGTRACAPRARFSEVGPLLEQLTALEVLSLSNNTVHSLAGCASMGRLTTLNINFNRVASLEPLSSCPLLEKLFASSNKISTVAPLAACTRLKELSLFRNLVASLDGTLAVLEQLTALRVLDLGANPCALGSPYRHRIVSTLRLECLDGDPLTELDGELAADFGAPSGASEQGEAAASTDTRGGGERRRRLAGSPADDRPARHPRACFVPPTVEKGAACSRPPTKAPPGAHRALQPRAPAAEARGRVGSCGGVGAVARSSLGGRRGRRPLPQLQRHPTRLLVASGARAGRPILGAGGCSELVRRHRRCPAASCIFVSQWGRLPARSRLTCLSPCAPPHLAPLALRFQPASTRLGRPPALGRRRRGGRVRHEPSAANG